MKKFLTGKYFKNFVPKKLEYNNEILSLFILLANNSIKFNRIEKVIIIKINKLSLLLINLKILLKRLLFEFSIIKLILHSDINNIRIFEHVLRQLQTNTFKYISNC
jgi:hypothetical protein